MKTQSLAVFAVGLLVGVTSGQPYTLSERITVDTKYNVRMRVDITGSLTPPSAKGKTSTRVQVEGSSLIDYDERVLRVDSNGAVSKTLRHCERMHFRRTLAGQPQELSLRNGVRRLVILRKGHTEVPFSPDGPLTWGEIDAVRTDVFVPALLGLLPSQPVREGDTWTAPPSAAKELTDLEKIDSGALACKFDSIVEQNRRRLARIQFSGTLDGIGEDGPVRHKLQGYCSFDLDGRFLAELALTGTTLLLDESGNEAGKIDGRLALTRSLQTTSPQIEDAALRGVKLEPDDQNTRMLYDNAELGVKFLFHRRWYVAQVMGMQVALATKDGQGLLITVDPPANMPTANAFLDESRTWLVQQKAKVKQTYTPRRIRERPPLDGFAIEAELAGQKLWMDYYVTAQQGGGATIAARLSQDSQLAELRREAEAIARSVIITKPIVPRSNKK